MGRVIAVANQKGGVSKTTTSTALAAGLRLRGKSVLLLDVDPQCNASDTYQAQIQDAATLYDVLCQGETAANAVQHTEIGDIIPSDPLLIQAENLLSRTGKEYVLKKAVAGIRETYDYIVIDTPPALGVLLINALTCAETVIVPITADRYSLQGLAQLQETIAAAQEYTNPSLTVAGLLLTRYNGRTNLGKEVAEGLPLIAEQLHTTIFQTFIRESIGAKEAQAMRKSLFDHAGNGTTAQDYLAFIDELLGRGI